MHLLGGNLACWASTSHSMAACAAVEQQLRVCMDEAVRSSSPQPLFSRFFPPPLFPFFCFLFPVIASPENPREGEMADLFLHCVWKNRNRQPRRKTPSITTSCGCIPRLRGQGGRTNDLVAGILRGEGVGGRGKMRGGRRTLIRWRDFR